MIGSQRVFEGYKRLCPSVQKSNKPAYQSGTAGQYKVGHDCIKQPIKQVKECTYPVYSFKTFRNLVMCTHVIRDF